MAADFLNRQQRTPLAARPAIKDLQHFTICRDKGTYCGHPRQGVFKHFGGGEVVIAHHHAPCEYKVDTDVQHGPEGYRGRSMTILQRSRDGGLTWPAEDNVVIYKETMTPEEKRAFLYQADAPRADYDMFSPESLFFFGRTWVSGDSSKPAVCFGLRSPDKGQTWEMTPTVVTHPEGEGLWVLKDCHPVARMPDGQTLLAAMTVGIPGGPGIYRSTDNGVTWQFLSTVALDPSGPAGRFTYVGLLLMPDEVLHCYYLHVSIEGEAVDGVQNAICMSVSQDRGQSWSDPIPIVGKGRDCWKEPSGAGFQYRSPWSILLRDGRILVVFARRRLPMGIGGVISSDGGQTWSEEFVIRDDAIRNDLGYPVGYERDDDRIFIAYYYTLPDGNGFGGTRHIAGSVFRVE